MGASVGVLLYHHRFQWSAANFAPDFSIAPVEGYISPGMEVSRAAGHQLHLVCGHWTHGYIRSCHTVAGSGDFFVTHLSLTCHLFVTLFRCLLRSPSTQPKSAKTSDMIR